MNSHHLIAVLIGGVLVVAGAVVGAQFTGPKQAPPAADEQVAGGRIDDPPRPAPRPPVLGKTEVAGLHQRLAAMEQRLDAMQTSIDELKESLAPLRELYEQAEKLEEGALERMAEEDGSAVMPGHLEAGGGDHMGRGYAQRLTRTLGLDGERRRAFTEEFDRLMDRVEAKELEHAKVTVDGDQTTIEIPRYPDGGDSLQRSWNDWIDGNLTPEEREAYRKERATNRLFGNRLGSLARTITIDEAGGGINVSEKAEMEGGASYQTQMQGPALARDLILESYLHLLK